MSRRQCSELGELVEPQSPVATAILARQPTSYASIEPNLTSTHCISGPDGLPVDTASSSNKLLIPALKGADQASCSSHAKLTAQVPRVYPFNRAELPFSVTALANFLNA